jgi:signal transduction histidine kinase
MNFEKYVPYPLFNRAVAYDKLGNKKEAESNYLQAIKIHEKYKNYFELANSYSSLAALYLQSNQSEKAISSAIKGIDFSQKINSKEFQISSYKTLSEAYKKSKNYSKAVYYFSIYDSLNNDYYEENKLKITKNLSAKYQTEKKEKELLKTKAEKATTELELNQQRQLSYGLVGGLIVLLLLGYSLFQRNKRKHTLSIAKQKEEGLQAIIQAEENERTKIARELHDGVVQQIGSVILKSRNVLENLNVLDKPESQELLKSLEDSNQDLRNISHQMMPRALQELGIVAALQDLIDGSISMLNIESKFEHFNITKRLPNKVEVTIYRVVQELINNIIKHSKATEVSIQLFKTDNDVILIVEDNGVGISDKQKKKGMGLMNISSRLDMVNGQVNFEPSPQSGTLVTVKIPV